MKKSWVPLRNDHGGHFRAGLAISFGIALICVFLIPSIAAYLVALSLWIVGWGKEVVYDRWMHKGTPEFADALITFAGCFPAIMAIWVYEFWQAGFVAWFGQAIKILFM